MADGSSQTDAAGTITNEKIDDSLMGLGLTLGLRQPLFRDKLRIIVSGHGDFSVRLDRDDLRRRIGAGRRDADRRASTPSASKRSSRTSRSISPG